MKNQMTKGLTIGLILLAFAMTACSKSVNGVNPPPNVGGNPGGFEPTPVPREVSTTFEGTLDCSGHLCGGEAIFDLGTKVVENENDFVVITLPPIITNGCSFVEGESCSTNMFDAPKSTLTFEGETGSCIYDLLGSPTRYQARQVACTIEVDKTVSVIKTDAPDESSLRITLKYSIWE